MSALFLVCLGGIGLYVVKILVPKKTLAPLPPGPTPKSLIQLIMGNHTDFPSAGEQEWVHWTKHKDIYGPISSVTVLGQTYVIVNDKRIAFDLLEKRETLSPNSQLRVGWENVVVGLPYSKRFHTHRKYIHAIIGSKSATSRLYGDVDIEVRRFLLSVFEEPERLLQHIRTEAGAIVLKISYGYTVDPRNRDPLVDLANEAMLHFALATLPGVWLVDTIPLLKYLPDWIPGMAFKRTAAHWRKTLTELVEKPHAFVKQQMATGVYSPSFTSAHLEKGDISPEEEHDVKWSSVALYAGGADTTVSALASFFLAMTVYPEVQCKAQGEIDRVIGNDRLPGFEDRENLPYIGAIVKEVLRWHPVVPMGLPHASIEDDIYEGHFIPKGALVIPNIWWFLHDPQTYHDPMAFKPERFLGIEGRAPEMDPQFLSFGFGRRICPGRELADASLYLIIAQSLAVFNISKAIENGKVIEPVIAFTAGIISHPVPYKTSVKPRSMKAEVLIRSIQEEHPITTSDAETLRSI